MHQDINADVRTLFYCNGSTNPGALDEQIPNNLFDPYRGVGEDFAAKNFDRHGRNQHYVEDQQKPKLGVAVNSSQNTHLLSNLLAKADSQRVL